MSSDAERYNYLNMNKSYKRQRSQRDYPFKKRKFFDCSSVSNSDEGISSDGISSVPEYGYGGGALGSGPSLTTGYFSSACTTHLYNQ